MVSSVTLPVFYCLGVPRASSDLPFSVLQRFCIQEITDSDPGCGLRYHMVVFTMVLSGSRECYFSKIPPKQCNKNTLQHAGDRRLSVRDWG